MYIEESQLREFITDAGLVSQSDFDAAEEIVEIAGVFKAKCIGNIGNVPVCMLQKGCCLTGNAMANVFGGWFAGYLLYRPVKVIYMYAKHRSEVLG